MASESFDDLWLAQIKGNIARAHAIAARNAKARELTRDSLDDFFERAMGVLDQDD